jgi:NTE family protein
VEKIFCRLAVAIAGLALCGCSALKTMYLPTQTMPLQQDTATGSDTRCEAPEPQTAPAYYLENLRNCTSPDSLVIFAFSGGGIRSASFGYGVLQAAHSIDMPDAKGAHPLDRDIDIVSGVSGGSFTAAAFATHHDTLFPQPGKPDYYRDNFLTHDFFYDLAMLYLSPLHWRWLFPYYGTNDELADIYAGIDFSASGDKVFAANFGELAKKGRPLLVVQATDYGNEQPFTFTQNDFDLICSDVGRYPVGHAIAASSAFPILFSPIQLTNHHFAAAGERGEAYCQHHRALWVDDVLKDGEPRDLSRLYARAQAASHYQPPRGETVHSVAGQPSSQPLYVYLQDGGASDNVALRGLSNIVIQSVRDLNGTARWSDPKACSLGLDKLRKILIVVSDGQALPNRTVSSLPYLADLGLILDVTSSTMIDANGLETMFASDALSRQLAAKFSLLDCGNPPTAGAADAAAPIEPRVKAYFARVSFANLDGTADLGNSAPCDKEKGERCTVDDLAHSGTSLAVSGDQVDALVKAGRSAFLCNLKIRQFLAESNAAPPPSPALACAPHQ